MKISEGFKIKLVELAIMIPIILAVLTIMFVIIIVLATYFDPDNVIKNIKINGEEVQLLQLRNESWLHCINCEIVE